MKTVITLLLLICPRLLLAQDVRISPSGYHVDIVGHVTQITCSSTTNDRLEEVQWLVNLTLTTGQFEPSSGIGSLSITLSVNHNMISIQCIGTFASGANSTSAQVILLVQGLLDAVGNLTANMNGSNVILSWTAPLSLDIKEGPDIDGYFVKVYKNDLCVSNSSTRETGFNYTLHSDSNDACHNYTFIVEALNIVGSGHPNSVSSPNSLSVVDNMMGVSTLPTGDQKISMSSGVCNATLVCEDLDTGESITLGDGELTIEENAITFTTEQLTDNRLYSVTVNATNAAGSTSSPPITISTHDILNATTTETGVDAIVITTLYSEHSDARGALFDFVFIDDNGDVDFTRSVLLALDRNTSLHHTLPFNLYPGQYRVFVYDIESNGALSNGVGYPAVMNLFTSKNGTGSSKCIPIKYCQITTNLTVITAECTFPSDVMPMVTGFQMIAQSSNSSEVHKLHVSQSMDLQTPVTVEVEESGVYQVAVIPVTGTIGSDVVCIEEVMVNTNTSSGVAVGVSSRIIIIVTVTLVSTLLMVTILPLLLLAYKRHCHLKGLPMNSEMTPIMNPNRSTCGWLWRRNKRPLYTNVSVTPQYQDERELPLLNVLTAHPIGTEGDDQSEVQTKGTGDDAEHGTEEQTKDTEKEAIQDAAHPIVTEGGDGGVQANGTCDDAEHEVTGTEGVQVIEEETKVTEGVHNEEHSVAENSVAGTEDAQEIEGKDNVDENAKAIQHIEDKDECDILPEPPMTAHYKKDVIEVQIDAPSNDIEIVPDHDVPQLPPITPSDGRIMNAHHFNGTGAKQIDHEPQNNALIKDDLEAAPLKKEINTDNVAEDKVGELSQDVCQNRGGSNLAIPEPDVIPNRGPPKRQLRNFSQEIDGPHDAVINMEEVVRPHSKNMEIVDDAHKPREGSAIKDAAHSIETEGGASEVQTDGTGNDAEYGTEDAQEIEGQTENVQSGQE